MAQLDARDGAVLAQERGHPGQAGDVLVGPEAHVAVADPAVGGDPGGLHDDQPEPAEGEAAQVDQVVVADQAVGSRVLAHRRHDEAVGERDAPQGQGLQQLGSGHVRGNR
ncbi:hypothetical protein SAMN05661080_03479 [Modestobacter sp. DSM 44400]|nr:hypothetical protein SAMN05661080_03479 [Modestobacter sp. DSM 44400]